MIEIKKIILGLINVIYAHTYKKRKHKFCLNVITRTDYWN